MADNPTMEVQSSAVGALWRWPVKSMGGEPMPSVRVDGRGVGGDRSHAVLRRGETGWEPLPSRDESGLGDWSAAYPFNIGANVDPPAPPYALVTAPGGAVYVWGDPRLRCALEDQLGGPLQLRRDVHGLHVLERTVLVSWGDADPRALRANVHVDLDLDGDGDGEWERGTLTFEHGVRMRLLAPCPRGGMYARVIANGRVAAGEGLVATPFAGSAVRSASASATAGR
jgi:hypothetical protein